MKLNELNEFWFDLIWFVGCKIKALRAKTNTYIKTPVRGEEPVFVVTGRKEDVAAAKREILSAAEHFSQIRASRRSGIVGQGLTGTTGLVPPPPVPGQVTIQVSLLHLLSSLRPLKLAIRWSNSFLSQNQAIDAFSSWIDVINGLNDGIFWYCWWEINRKDEIIVILVEFITIN